MKTDNAISDVMKTETITEVYYPDHRQGRALSCGGKLLFLPPQFVQHPLGLAMTQVLQLHPEPLAGSGRPDPEQGLARLGQVLAGMPLV